MEIAAHILSSVKTETPVCHIDYSGGIPIPAMVVLCSKFSPVLVCECGVGNGSGKPASGVSSDCNDGSVWFQTQLIGSPAVPWWVNSFPIPVNLRVMLVCGEPCPLQSLVLLMKLCYIWSHSDFLL
jgi:hypothetical protein